MKPPPPMPIEYGSTTPSAASPATAASTALPPCLSTSSAAWLAYGSTVATAPFLPTSTDWATGGRSAAAAGTASRQQKTRASRTMRMAQFCPGLSPFMKRKGTVPLCGRGVGLRPGDDLVRATDAGAVVELEDRHPVLAGQLLGTLAAPGLVERVGQEAEAVGLDDLRLVPGRHERVMRVLAGMSARTRRREQAVADVELHANEATPCRRPDGSLETDCDPPGADGAP